MKKRGEQSNWVIDPVHTRIRFDAKYLLITSVSGWFRELEGTVSTEHDDFDECQIALTIYTSSLYTGIEERDNHLRSSDFFDTLKYPTIEFRSTSVKVQEEGIEVQGRLSIKDASQEIRFVARHLGTVQDPMGNTKAGFEMSTVFDRKAFNINWNQYFDKQGVLLSDEVAIHCDLQLLKLESAGAGS